MQPIFSAILKDQINFLLFRPIKPPLGRSYSAYLAWGLLVTWLVGIGRYWDHPSAELWQYAGLGSVLYIYVLAGLVWAIAQPLKPKNFSYKNILLFISLTSLPAALYSIPVERFMSLGNAKVANMLFLAVVASWRVALLAVFLQRVAKLSGRAVFVATVLPLTLIVTALVALNLEHAVFEVMGGLRDETSNDAAYFIMIAISTLSIIATPIFVIWYGFLVYFAHKKPASP
ncbi:hypothetical protein PsAD13_00667 [Pseudovibrio sp. Ad13]|uniref:hypothetical protein n=1 Tax=unclassified Pseudovibrio TaxID=2627060 RepID=UPI0007AE3C97|nr:MULTISPECIES: hypothetical protein [unclassified Pseudovibrio]KZK87394.1 hypothetical protein PsAD13_00667 [Pseudovibrio sp. Ad13]KZK95616.1 hypothetical protein PsAD46_00626 [Pseudovibrio sp. Ad46]KZL15939.1 hypothetical protein PsAD26_00635 [Pseudovibrio sp. Ad26]